MLILYLILQMSFSNYQEKILLQFGLTSAEIKNLCSVPRNPKQNPIKGEYFIRNNTSKTGIIMTHRQQHNDGMQCFQSNYMLDICFESNVYVAFYNSCDSYEIVMKNKPVVENENFLCGFTPESDHLYELICDHASQKYFIVDRTRNSSKLYCC
jgi:hypothetical protein